MWRIFCSCLGCPSFVWALFCWWGFIFVRRLHLQGVWIHSQTICSNFSCFFGYFINCLYLRSLTVSASITSNAWWASFSNCVMWVVSRHMCLLAVNSTDDARPFCFLLSICSNRVRAIVLLDGSASALRFFIFCCALVRLLLLKLSLWLYTNIFYFSVLVPVIFPPLELLVWIFSKTVWRPVSLILFYRSHCCCCSSSP